ncbi:short chain dehydrogenase family protein [Acinetobacter sp. 21871]|nr:short chain dehydrogenase family protein [Acinetobacter sp. 21871]EXB63552.1 short chain dehydrogenase family protein [Acinetobacter sp. 21871]EXB64346.1 short chain dehydrogenase family protein [Acinetobacter sp. 21871]EXB66065.1 short chain dehydrogenase family protein [Acinetobacter sp. 21871]EXR64103.1 short chain dehydrogenase family protein [Acinetobacter sp. 1424608]
MGADAILIQADLTDIDNIEKLFLDTKQHFGGIDIAINTVGKVLKKSFLETTEQEFDSMSDINSKIEPVNYFV